MIKKLRKPGPVSWLAAVIIRLLGLTVRCRIEDRCGLLRGEIDQPVIWIFWHNRVLLMPYFARTACPDREIVVLVSPSNDGEIIARLLRGFGYGAVRGSSNKRPAAALRELARILGAGMDVAIAPDGPRGPRYRFQTGAIKLAQLSQCSLMAVHVEYDRAWRLKTWDGFLIPKPFSRATLVLAALVPVARELSRSELEGVRLEVETAMIRGAEESFIHHA